MRKINTDERIIYNSKILKKTPLSGWKQQKELGRSARLNRSSKEFIVKLPQESYDPEATLYIVIDDVVTTGSSLKAAIEALKDKGLKNVVGLAVAH